MTYNPGLEASLEIAGKEGQPEGTICRAMKGFSIHRYHGLDTTYEQNDRVIHVIPAALSLPYLIQHMPN